MVCTSLKGTISSQAAQTFNRAWNRCPSYKDETSDLTLLAHLWSSNGNMTLTCGVLFSVTELI